MTQSDRGPVMPLPPDTLPTRCLWLKAPDHNLRAALSGFDWSPLVPLDASNCARTNFDFAGCWYFCDAMSAPKLQADTNHYGAYFLVTVGAHGAEVSFIGGDSFYGEEVAVWMRMVEFLLREARVTFRWGVCAYYEDSGESGGHVEGDSSELLARLAAD